jgi:CRISPR type IV-associated protein Csf1
MITTACQLLALAELGRERLDVGDQRCFFCGAACDESRPAKKKVKKTFTDWPSVANPSGDFVCAGCMLALEEKADIAGRSRQKRRNYTWLLTAAAATPLTKAQLDRIRAVCLNPPEPPWALTIADSGQKQLLYRTPVNHDRATVTVQLETEQVTYRPAELAARYRQALDLVQGGIGKSKLLDEYLPIGLVLRLAQVYDDADVRLDAWRRVRGEPLSRLAVFLCPGKPKEDSADE